MGVILDSSVWIAFFHKEDSQYEKAQFLIEEVTERIFVPEYVLIEVASILRNYKRNAEAEEFIKRTFNTNGMLIPAANLVYEAGALFCERHDKLSFIDTALLVLSRDYRVITFDKALARALAK